MLKKAKWITANLPAGWGNPEKIEDFPISPYIAKSFYIEKEIAKAALYIVGYGQAAYYVNGERIPDSFLPTHPSNPLQAVIYNTYDITDMLKIGQNRVGAVLGNNITNDINVNRWRFEPKMIACLDVTYLDGARMQILSDSSWKTAPSPILFSMRKCGEKYDARLNIKNWCASDFDDSKWDNVDICRGPGGVFRSTVCPPIRVKKQIVGKEIAKGLFDFGENTSGWVKIMVSGREGEELIIKYAERITADGLHADQNGIITAYEPMAHKDRYILNGESGQEWEQLFSYHGFRYVEVEGEYDSLQLTAMVAYTDILPASYFKTDCEVINKIHSATVNSILTNCHGALTDCPTREQNEWTGDGLLSAEAASIGFYSYDMFYEWMQKFREDQFPNGALPCIIPAKNWLWESNFASGTDWDSAIIQIPYYCFKYTGNPDIVNLMWDNMCRNLEFFETLSETELLSNGVGDWCSIAPMCNKEITDTAYYRKNLLMMAEMAAATGRNGAEFNRKADCVKLAFRQKYIKDGKLTDSHETALAATLWSQMTEGDEAKVLAAELEQTLSKNGYRFLGGVHELFMIFDVLSCYGYNQTLFDTVVNDKYPGYGYCIKKGLTTLPERFDFEHFIGDSDSLNHHFRSSVISWFYKGLAGININGFGFEKVVIKPNFVNGVNSLEAQLHDISVSYNENEFSVSSPYDFTLILGDKTEKYSAGEYTFNR